MIASILHALEAEPRLTHLSLKVLRFLATRSACGADLMEETGAGTGTIYPMLKRFEAIGWLRSKWEKIDPSKAGRPRRRLYTMTAVGRRSMNEALRELGAAP